MKLINDSLFLKLTSQASKSPRGRQHLNFHESFDEPSQRMLIAIEPGSYIRPHRHLEVPKPEAFFVLKGSLVMLTFDDQGTVMESTVLQQDGPTFGAELPKGVWHTLVALEPGTILYETKPGPFQPIPQGDMAPWAPAEGDSDASDYLRSLLDEVGI